MKEFIKNKLETRRTVYLTDSNIILEDFRKEKEKIEEYNGRQLLEMLQNADDEAITNKEKICFIKLANTQLTIANNGRKFSEGGIESLMYSNLSPKVNEQNKVGQKGLGFRSILSWANKITIKSCDFAVEFSEETAKEFLNSLFEEKPVIKSQLIEKEKNEKYPIAILRCPKILETIPENLSDYDTYIIVDLKESQIQEVQEQINNEINKEVLLFLNNIEKIIVESPERNFVIKKAVLENKVVVQESGKDVIKKWNIKSKTGSHQGKNYELKIAWNDNLDDKIGRLYSYFKTNVKFPFPAIIHGTFDLTSDRNHFTPKSEHNIFLIGELIQLLIDTALDISKSEISYKPLQLLNIRGEENFDSFFEDNKFSEKLKNKIRENQIFPTISNQYISIGNQPIFYKNNYAEILPKEKFPNIMLYSENRDIVKMIEWLEVKNCCEQKYLFESISEISGQLNLEQRAKLISYLTEDFKNIQIPKKELPDIFIDQDNHIIDSDSEIFLPPSGEKIEIPIKLNLRIIRSDLFSQIKKILNVENAEVIENELKLFGIKVYRFGDIFRKIVSDFNNNTDKLKNKRDLIKELLSGLYSIYIKNKDKEGININIPSDILIPILNKNNGETKVSKVYLGKEYENKLCEILYEYDKSKLVGSPKTLGLEDNENVKEFLKWLGVEEYPRKKLIQGDKDYCEFAIKSFPYKEKRIYWYDATINSYKKLKEQGYWIEDIKVETIEDLENILKNNSNENVLYWLSRDKRIIEPNEVNKNSKLTIGISNKRYNADISYNNLPSYLLWKIKRINWIKTKTDETAKPADCCIAKTITKDFSPFIEIPKIEYDCQLFKDSKIAREDIDYTLLKIGINKEISNFPTERIYEILSNLHNIDKEGKFAKLIYREIADNLDEREIDKDSNSYKQFIQSGLVFCKINDKYSYQSVSDVYYVDNKTFGEDIINQFHTIEIGRRKGAKKIETLFGVTSLGNMEFSLSSTPITHHLNNLFQNEIEILKPYIYAFRLSKDTDGKELKWIKNSKITLCTKIEPKYTHKGLVKDFELKPYEFIYIEKRSEIYLLINENQYNSITDFQADYIFPDSIAEIYSSIIKVDSHRNSFSRLFEANIGKKNHIIKTELDDKNLEQLNLAKSKLNIVDDPKIQFWLSILYTLNKKDYEYRKYEDSEFIDLIRSQININPNDFSINYYDFEDFTNFPVLIDLFKKLEIDVADYNKNSTKRLDFIPYHKDSIQQLKNDYQTAFEILLFLQLQERPIYEQEKFLDSQSFFEKFDQFDIENSVNINIVELFIETIRDTFKIDLSIKYDCIDIQKIYKNNLANLENGIPSLKKRQLYEIIENGKFRSLIYFAEFENIIEEYNNTIKTAEEEKEMTFNGSTLKVTKDNYSELYSQITKQNLDTKLEKITTTKPEVAIENDKKSIAKGTSKNIVSTTDKETLGFIGETIVFESLKKKFGDENVIWDSGYAQKANINPKGNDNKHYDIKYRNKLGKWNFVEVKTTTSDKLEFKISNFEVNFGIENKLVYEIMIVTNAYEQEKRRIKILSCPFKFGKNESFTNNMKFLVLNDNFTIKLSEE